MTTTAELITDTQQHLLSPTTREERNRLDGNILANATSLTFEFAPTGVGIKAGAMLEIDLELFHVWSVAGQVVTVTGGQLGSTPAAHSDNADIIVNPRFPKYRVLRALNDDLAALSSPKHGLFRVMTTEFTYSPAVQGYDLPATALDVIDVTTDTPGADNTHPRIRDYRFVTDANVADFTTGRGIVLYDPGYSGRLVRVRYKAAFGSLATLADNVETTTGLPASAHRIPPLGAAVLLMAGREVKRNFTESQPDARRADEVPPGAVLGSARALRDRYETFIREEAARLAQQYPVRSK